MIESILAIDTCRPLMRPLVEYFFLIFRYEFLYSDSIVAVYVWGIRSMDKPIYLLRYSIVTSN